MLVTVVPDAFAISEVTGTIGVLLGFWGGLKAGVFAERRWPRPRPRATRGGRRHPWRGMQR